MDLYTLFVLQFSGVLLGVVILTYVFFWPQLQRLPEQQRLIICLAPQMFRLMALGLLHPGLSPGLAMTFAVPTVIVDVAVSLLAMLAVLALHRGLAWGRLVAWCVVGLGSLHMLVSGFYAPQYEFPLHLQGQWLVPVTLGPVMLVSIALSFWTLWRPASVAENAH